MSAHRTAPLLLVLLLSLSLPCPAATLFVSKSGDGTTGQSWESAFQEIGTAILASTTGDEIWVATGTYVENVAITVPLTILGGFSGDESLQQRDERDAEMNLTTVDGNQLGSVFLVRRDVNLEGLVIQNGLSSDGSGIHAMGCNLALTRSKIISNGESGNRGGGVYMRDGNLTLEECHVNANRSKENGGGVYAERSEIRIVDSQCHANVSGSLGSGIYVGQVLGKIINSEIAKNGNKTESGAGGGIEIVDSTMEIVSSHFRENVFAGAVIVRSTADISGTEFIGNDGGNAGGGIYVTAGSLYTIDRCLFRENKTIPPIEKHTSEKQVPVLDTRGGAIYTQSSTGLISNSLFIQNMSRGGSVVAVIDSGEGDVVFGNCTMDIDTDYLGTFAVGWAFGEPPSFLNCIFVSDGPYYFFGRDGASVTHSFVEGGFPGEGNIEGDPKFVDSANGDYHLERSSPCIDSGTDTGLTSDFDGNFRPIGDYDMGAFEFPSLRSDIDGSGKVDSTDLLILQEDWGLVSGV